MFFPEGHQTVVELVKCAQPDGDLDLAEVIVLTAFDNTIGTLLRSLEVAAERIPILADG